MVVLTIVFLAGLYIAKIFFPHEFVMAIENEKIVMIGDFIDSRQWLYDICCLITSFFTYFLYCCSVCHKKITNWKETVLIFGVVIFLNVIYYFDETLYTALSIASFIFLPCIMRGNFKTFAIVFTTHLTAQSLSLTIRGLPLYFTNQPNFITMFFMTVEMYLWLILFYIIYNYKKGENENG